LGNKGPEAQMVMREHLQAIVTVLSLVNPVVCGAMFARIEANSSRGQQMADAQFALTGLRQFWT
jgi:hypothetical protein